MSTNAGKKNIAHKGSGHGAVAPAAVSLVTPPAPPVPVPFPYTARASNAGDTTAKLTIGGHPVLVEGSTMTLDPPANQPAQSGGGDVVTHATKNIAVMTTGSAVLTVEGKGVCCTGDLAAMNVLTKQSKIAQMTVPLLEAADFETARKSKGAAAAMNKKYKRAHPPSKANQCPGGHPVDLGTGYVIDDAVDLSLPGFVPLVWARSYTSARHKERGALGRGGWWHSFEPWIEATENGYRFHNEEGLPVDFAPVGEAGFSFHRGQRLELRKMGSGIEIRSLNDRLIRSFSPLPGGRVALRSIRDTRDHAIRLEYDADRLARIVDSVGRELRLTSDDKGRVTRVEVWASAPGSQEPPSLQTWFDYAYHVEGELAGHTNALGHAERWEYDGLHRMTKVTLRNGVSFYYEYDPDEGHCVRTWGDGGLHDVRLEIDFAKGETRTHGTNRARRYLWKNGIVHREETFGGDWAVERIYDDDELLVATKDGAGNTTIYERDARANLIGITDPAGNSWRWEYQDDLPTRHVAPVDLETRYYYDEHGTPVGLTLPTGVPLSVDMDRDGRVVALYRQARAMGKLEYDEHGNVRAATSPREAVTHYRYDALGRAVERADAFGRKTLLAYDRQGHVVELRRADGTRLVWTYEPLGEVATATDPLGHATRFDYSGTGVLARVVRPDAQVYRLLYDSDERLVRILNPRLEAHEFEYDRADQMVAERTFDGRLIEYRYNRAGLLTRVDHPDKEWREFAYDKLGSVLEDRGEDVQIAYARDALGRVEKATCRDVTGKVVTELERDRFGRLTADIQNGRAVRYEYDVRGRRIARTLPDGERTSYEYETDGAFGAVVHGGTRVVIDRDALGRERTRRAKGWTLASEYDALDRIAEQTAIAPAPGGGMATTLVRRRYAYDAKGRLTSVESSHAGRLSYAYDAIDQVVDARSRALHEAFEYDPTGSLVRTLDEVGFGGGNWSMKPGNVLARTARARYANDGRGRRIQRVEAGVNGSVDRTTTYGWDSKDRLREVVQSDGSRVRFAYDAFGRRVRKDVLGPPVPLSDWLTGPEKARRAAEKRSVEFLWDGDVLCEQREARGEDCSGKRVYVHEPGTFVPMLQAEGGEVFAYVNDHLGTPKELVDAGGAVVWAAMHSTWGAVVETRGREGFHGSPFRLLGQYFDEETGLCYTRFRYFDGTHGRWLSPDPIGVSGGANLFGYNIAPTLGRDPFGLAYVQGQDYPYGFVSYEQFRQYAIATQAGLSQAGYRETAPFMQGSATTGVEFSPPYRPFDVGRESDFDVALAGNQIYARAQELELTKGERTGPLTDADIEALGLSPLRQKMARLAGGRTINFMIFENIEAARAKSIASIAFPGCRR